MPDEAAKEIRRVGRHQRVVAVAMGTNGLGKNFGNPIYNPIFQAAEELRLPIIIHCGTEQSPGTLTHATAGGIPASYVERYILRAQSVQVHLTSLICQGVFDRFPNLRVLVVGAGANWLPSWIWRLDEDYKALGFRDVPVIRRLPSDYVRENVRITTYSLARSAFTPPMVRALNTEPWIADVLCFASGYPSWDSNDPTRVGASLPIEWRERVMFKNALEFFRWAA
jgi:predicted TIM-barrel fold metal-dependent hydrolase